MPQFGTETGPTGRKRDKYSTIAYLRNGRMVGREKRYGGNSTQAYGRDGLRQAKRHIHAKAPHAWMSFYSYNETKHSRRPVEGHKAPKDTSMKAPKQKGLR